MSHVERAHGAAQRRRARMVRSWWRHEQRSIAAAVATMLHHSAGRKPHPTLVDAATQVGSQFSTTAVDPYAPRVVGSLLPLEEFTEPVYDQVHQEQFAAGEMTENMVEIPVVQEQVIVGTRPERLVDARGPQGGLERAACPRSEAPLLSPVVMVQEAAHDDITAAFLLTQSLRQRQEEVEDAAMGREEDEEDVEEDDQMLEYFCEDCVFLEMRNNEWQSLGLGAARLLRHSNGAVFFQFWQYEHLIIDDVVQRFGDPRLVLRPVRFGGERVWVWSDPDYAGGPGDYLHAVRFASQELGRRFHDEWAATG